MISSFRIIPLSPTNRLPVAGIDFPSSSNSSGVYGRIPPSYQYNLSAGHWPWAANLKHTRLAYGNEKSFDFIVLTWSLISQLWLV